MKSKLSILVISILVVSMLLATTAFASKVVVVDGKAAAYDAVAAEWVETETAKAGDTITVTYGLSDYDETNPVNNVQLKVILPDDAEYVADSAAILLADAANAGINYVAGSNAVIFTYTNIDSVIPTDAADLFSFQYTINADAKEGAILRCATQVEILGYDTMDDSTDALFTLDDAVVTVTVPTGDTVVVFAAVLAVALAAAVVIKRKVNA